MLRLTVETETGHVAELRVSRTIDGAFSVRSAAHWGRIVTPFITLKTFPLEADADEYALRLKAALLGLTMREVEPT